jgi:hypothetical protein
MQNDYLLSIWVIIKTRLSDRRKADTNKKAKTALIQANFNIISNSRKYWWSSRKKSTFIEFREANNWSKNELYMIHNKEAIDNIIVISRYLTNKIRFLDVFKNLFIIRVKLISFNFINKWLFIL